MKKKLTILAILLVMIMLTGCVFVQYELTINEDQSAKVAYILATDGQMAQFLIQPGGPLYDGRVFAEQNGFKTSDYYLNNSIGFKAEKDLKNISEFSLSKDLEFANKYFGATGDKVSLKKGLLTNSYIIDMDVDLAVLYKTLDAEITEMMAASRGSENVSPEQVTEMRNQLLQSSRFKFVVNTPGVAKVSNATNSTTDKKTFEWILKIGESNKISLTAITYNYINISILSGVLILLLAALIVVLVILRLKRKQHEITVYDDDDYTEQEDDSEGIEEASENDEETKPAEENPAEENPAEENPAEENPAEENPAEEKPAEENPAEEKSADENPAEENPEEFKEE